MATSPFSRFPPPPLSPGSGADDGFPRHALGALRALVEKRVAEAAWLGWEFDHVEESEERGTEAVARALRLDEELRLRLDAVCLGVLETSVLEALAEVGAGESCGKSACGAACGTTQTRPWLRWQGCCLSRR